MIALAVIDPDEARRKLIREWLVRYTIREDCEFELLWLIDPDPRDAVRKYGPRAQIALVYTDPALEQDNGALLYRENPDCRILYYSSAPVDLEPLLPARPISFALLTQNEEVFLDKLHAVCREVEQSGTLFHFVGKRISYTLPKRGILYLRSDLRYVDIIQDSGEPIRILAKLNDLASELGSGFLRIHKSYLVNRDCMRALNRSSHTVLLSNGEELPVSTAQYEGVHTYFNEHNP